MRPDDRDDPFDDFFREIERMRNDMMDDQNVGVESGQTTNPAGADIHLDVYEEADTLRVVADIPGVDRDAIDLKCDGTVLTLDATGTTREYHERVQLPATVDEHSAAASYNNGILEVTFDRVDDSANIDLS
jgi:HSP20 family protein